MADPEHPDEILLQSIKSRILDLEALLDKVSSHWSYEDPIYRFYHQSFKVYYLQSETEKIVEALKGIKFGEPLNEWFMQIVAEGTGKQFKYEHNQRWLEETRPIVEAFFHARFFLCMVCQYGRELEQAPDLLPSGWAAVLYLFNQR